MTTEALYTQYKTVMRRIADIRYASAVLQWDQETYLPPKGAAIRGQQIATLNELAHEAFTDEKTGILLDALSAQNDCTPEQEANIRLTRYDYEKSKKLPASFVREISEAINVSFHAWIEARKNNSFTPFAAPLARIIALKKQEADLLGYETHPYNALMNDYDRGLTVATCDALFSTLQPQLQQLLQFIQSRPQVEDQFLYQHCDKDAQWKFGLELLKRMGFDGEAGRQDISEHPFTTSFNSQDVRVTTRISETDFANMTWSCIHEGGHALYEQGLPVDAYGLPLGEACSFSIHESQSRLWENNIGRSLPYWQHNFSLVQSFFPGSFSQIGVEAFYKAINKVQPSLIRTEADELTYHFHIMIRYEIEKELIGGGLTANDIPRRWNELYRDYLGVTVPDDRRGCLQDVHWCHGSFGYFPTYSIGSLYAAQLYAAILTENPSLEKEIAAGNPQNLLQWLRKHIHGFGRWHTSEALCTNATGKALDSTYFIDYVTKKYNTIYS
jgi:carboxypeptidase Taq